MDEIEAFRKSEECLLKLQREAAAEYARKIQDAYTKAHDLYINLLQE